MSSIRRPVIITFRGKEYTVKPENVMTLIEAVEDRITLEELAGGGAPKRARIAAAYLAVLRAAGETKYSQEDIYEHMFGEEGRDTIVGAVAGLLSLLVPPEAVARQTAKEAEKLKKSKKEPASPES